MNSFGVNLRQIRESKGLYLRQIAAELEIDTALISKIERGEKKATRQQVEKLAIILKEDKQYFKTLWLTDRLLDLAAGEPEGASALKLALDNFSLNGNHSLSR